MYKTRLVRLGELITFMLVVLGFGYGIRGYFEMVSANKEAAGAGKQQVESKWDEALVWTTALFLGELDFPDDAKETNDSAPAPVAPTGGKELALQKLKYARILAVTAITLVGIIVSFLLLDAYLREGLLGGFLGRCGLLHWPMLGRLFRCRPVPLFPEEAEGSCKVCYRLCRGWLRFFNLFRCRPDKVIIDLPDDLISLIPEKPRFLLQCGWWRRFFRPVVISVTTEECLVAKAARRAGHLVIQADRREPDFLQNFGLWKAQEVFIFGPDAPSNIDLGRECFKVMCCEQSLQPSRQEIRRIHFQCEDPDMRLACQTEVLGGTLLENLRQHHSQQLCNNCWVTARKLLDHTRAWLLRRVLDLLTSLCYLGLPLRYLARWGVRSLRWLGRRPAAAATPLSSARQLAESWLSAGLMKRTQPNEERWKPSAETLKAAFDRWHAKRLLLLEPFSLALSTARRALGEGQLTLLPTEEKQLQQPRTFHGGTAYIICGHGRWLRAFLEEAVKNSVVELERKPTIHLLTSGKQALEEKIRALFPEWRLLHVDSLVIHEVELQPELIASQAAAIISTLHQATAPWNFISVLEDDGDNCACASLVRSKVIATAITTFTTQVALNGAVEVAAQTCRSLLERGRLLFLVRHSRSFEREFQNTACLPRVQPIAPYGLAGSLDLISQKADLTLAMAVHKAYKHVQEGAALDDDTLASRFAEDELIKREQNFAQVQHLEAKLANLDLLPALHCKPEVVEKKIAELSNDFEQRLRREFAADLQPFPSAKTLQEVLHCLRSKLFQQPWVAQHPIMRLAALEHLRWMQHHILAGFAYASSDRVKIANYATTAVLKKKVQYHRLHDCLAHLQSAEFQQRLSTLVYDIDSVRILPLLIQKKQKLAQGKS